MGNALFGTFRTVDYPIDSSPAFLCQYVRKTLHTTYHIKTPNNGYANDSFDFTSPNSPLVTDQIVEINIYLIR